MDKDKLIKQQKREIERYKKLIDDAKYGLDITPKPEMSTQDILDSLIFLLKQNDIKSFSELGTLNVNLDKVPGNEHYSGYRGLFDKIETKIDEVDDRVLTIRLSFIDNYKNVITEIVRQARENIQESKKRD